MSEPWFPYVAGYVVIGFVSIAHLHALTRTGATVEMVTAMVLWSVLLPAAWRLCRTRGSRQSGKDSSTHTPPAAGSN